MQFSCEHCGTRYAVPDEKVRGKRVRTRCRKCGGEIIIQGPEFASRPGAPVAPAPSVPPTPRVDERWTVAVSRTEQRKMTTSEIVDAYAGRVVTDHTLVWKQGMAGWQPPFEIPAVALALEARGLTRSPAWREPGKISLPPPPPPRPAAQSVDALAAGWDDEDEATRVSEGALPFLARSLLPKTPASPPSAVPRRAPPRPPPSRRPGPPRSVPRPEPAPSSGLAWSDDETTRVVDGPSSLPLPPKVDTKRPPPFVPDPNAFSFDDEATEVIAPDRARALLEAEGAKDNGDDDGDPSETPVAFGFDDESAQAIDALLLTKTDKPAVEKPAAGENPFALTGEEPTIVVALPQKPDPEPPKPAPQPLKPAVEPRDIIRAFQNEPTRVVRAVKKKKGISQIWIVIALALVAAAAGGFIASEILARQHAPMRPRAP